MRPFLVLLLVLAAVGALLFAMFTGRSRKAAPIVGPETTQGTAVTPPRSTANLTSEPDVRTVPDEPTRVEIQPAVPVGSGAALVFDNGLTGVVMDEAGAPVVNAKVRLTFASTQVMFMDAIADRSFEREMITNDKGEFGFLRVEPSEYYTVVVTHPAYSPEEMSNIAIPLDRIVQGPAIVLRKGAELSGYVRDVNGSPVPEAQLVLDMNVFGEETSHAQRATVDGQGRYVFQNVAAGMRSLKVDVPGYGTQYHGGLAFDGRNSRTLDIVLEPAELIGGRVYGPDRQPLEGVEVTAINYSNANRSTRDTAVTDAQGQFMLEKLNKGTYTLLLAKVGYKRDRINRVETGDLNVIFELQRRAVIRGTVVNGETGEPVPGGELRLRETVEGTDLTAVTDMRGTFKNGEFEFPDVQAGDYLLEATAERHGLAATFSTPFNVTEGVDVNGVEVRMTRGASIKGRVVNARGEPVGGALVSTHENDFTTDEFNRMFGEMFPNNVTPRKIRTANDGTFELAAIRADPNPMQVTITHDSYSLWRKRDIRLVEGQVLDLGSVALSQGGIVQGTLRNRSGQVVGGQMVRLQPAIGQGGDEIRRPYTAITDIKGAFVIANVQPGNYDLSAIGSASSTANPFTSIANQEQSKVKVRIDEGRTATHDLVIYE